MGINTPPDAGFCALVNEFSLEPIHDDQQYRAAIAVLDRLFSLDHRRTPAERRYFRALACNARNYEQAFAMI